VTDQESAGIGTLRAFVFDVNYRDLTVLEKVMDAVFYSHHYSEDLVVFLREDRASRANYNPDNSNPIVGVTTPKGCPIESNGVR
jgi:hypothetical protein